MNSDPAGSSRGPLPIIVRYAAVAVGFGAFVLVCTMNAAGYRYGASDHALYIPAILRHLDPALFPRDFRLIDTQARLMVNDDVIAAIIRVTGVRLQTLFLV